MKFSIITGSYNMEPWIGKTIESIISQEGEFEIEYILMDGASKDRTVAIFEDYRAQVESGAWPVRCQKITMRSVSEKDTGVFDATNKAFALATGDIYTWADADNTYEPGAFQAVAKTFAAFPEIQWVHGITDAINDQWEKTAYGECRIYDQHWLQSGVYGREAYWVAQNGCFWRADLWKKIAPVPRDFYTAGDYWVWVQMAKFAPVHTLNVHLGNFMRRAGQLHMGEAYKAGQRLARPRRNLAAWHARMFFVPYYHLPWALQPFLETLYRFIFPLQNREYIDFENGKPVKRVMSSFVLHEPAK